MGGEGLRECASVWTYSVPNSIEGSERPPRGADQKGQRNRTLTQADLNAREAMVVDTVRRLDEEARRLEQERAAVGREAEKVEEMLEKARRQGRALEAQVTTSLTISLLLSLLQQFTPPFPSLVQLCAPPLPSPPALPQLCTPVPWLVWMSL